MNKLKKVITLMLLVQIFSLSVFKVQAAEIQATDIPVADVLTEAQAENLYVINGCVHDMEYGFDADVTNTYSHTITWTETIKEPGKPVRYEYHTEPCYWTVITTYVVYICLDCGYTEGVPYKSISTPHNNWHCSGF